MIFKNHIPQPPLKEYIDSVIYFKGYQPEHDRERVVPDGSINLIFEFDGLERSVYDNQTGKVCLKLNKVWLAGIQTKYITISSHQNSEMLVVRFKPGGGYPFLKIPLDSIKDRIIEAPEIWGGDIYRLREKILSERETDRKIQLMEMWLSEQGKFSLVGDQVIQNAVECVLSNASTRLKELVDKSHYSRKHFIELFKRYVGLSPKQFQRIMRFQETLAKVQNGELISWAQISADCGYFDQAHFIRDFKAFSGFNPTQFLQSHLENERINFFPLDEPG